MPAVNPNIVTRAQWGANPLVTPSDSIPVPTKELWLHHTAGEQFDEAGMRMLQSFTIHRQDAHYLDLEYSYVIDRVDCRIFESRGPGRDTAATFDHNGISHAICVMGNFEIDRPSEQLIDTLANLVAWGYEQGWWPLQITGGHRDASNNSTACPGDFLEEDIAAINFKAAHIHAGSNPIPPAPLPPKVKPMHALYEASWLADCPCPTGGAWMLTITGGVITLGGASFHGSPTGINVTLQPGEAWNQIRVPIHGDPKEPLQNLSGKPTSYVCVTSLDHRYGF